MDLEVEPPSHPVEATTHLDQAISYKQSQEFDRALVECDTILEIAPSLADAHNLRGMILEKLGRNAEAIEAYKTALELVPDFSGAKDNLAALEEKLALLPHWLRNSIAGILLFLAVAYSLELYLFSESHFFFVLLFTLYTPGIIIQHFLGSLESTGLESGILGWPIRIISSLTFGYIGGLVALKRKKVLVFSAISLMLLYLLFFGAWSLIFWLASSWY